MVNGQKLFLLLMRDIGGTRLLFYEGDYPHYFRSANVLY